MNRPVGSRGWPQGQRLVDSAKGKPVRLERRTASPNPGDDEQVRQWLESQSRPWVLDLFCGAGGLTLGLREARFSIVAASDSDATALESHAHNIGGLAWLGDLSGPVEAANQMNGREVT